MSQNLVDLFTCEEGIHTNECMTGNCSSFKTRPPPKVELNDSFQKSHADDDTD